MSFLSDIWEGFQAFLGTSLTFLHDLMAPIFGADAAWGWAIIALTLIVRTFLLPLAIKQTRSMRGMQAIQPKVKAIQKKYKVDRDLLKKDPETYQRKKQEMNEQLMALYKEEGVNPASSCLPLLLQMPIFFALFRVLQSDSRVPGLVDADFYFFTSFVDADAQFQGLGATISEAFWPGWLLIVLMAGSMFLTQRQMMARNATDGPAATQQKVMMYVFPIFLSVISFNFPLALVLYWVTTNIWQGLQQYLMFRTVADDEPTGGGPRSSKPDDKGTSPKGGARSSGAGSGTTSSDAASKKDGKPEKAPKPAKSKAKGGHLPKRRD